ncbi:MAG: hypothetical protein WAX29_11260 [Propionibacterium sp.]
MRDPRYVTGGLVTLRGSGLGRGALTGALYDYSVPVLIAVVVAIQVAALLLLWVLSRTSRSTQPSG